MKNFLGPRMDTTNSNMTYPDSLKFSSSSPYPVSEKDLQYASLAADVGKVLASATNCIRPHSNEGFIGDQCSCHAEIHALRKLYYSHVNSSFQRQRKRYCLLQWQKDEGFL